MALLRFARLAFGIIFFILVNHSSIVLVDAAFPPFPPESEHKCYFLSGAFDPKGGPCYGNVGASMCCYEGELCIEGSALCMTGPNGTPGPNDDGKSIWRRSCTDPTWQDGACMGIAYGNGAGSVQLTSCDDGTFCPRTATNQNTTCCDAGQGQVAILGSAIVPANVVTRIQMSTSSTAAIPTSSSTASRGSSVSAASGSPTSSASSVAAGQPQSSTNSLSSSPTSASSGAASQSQSSASPDSSSSQGDDGGGSSLSTGAKVGLGVGIALGVILIALASFIAFRLRKNKRAGEQHPPEEQNGFNTFYGNDGKAYVADNAQEKYGHEIKNSSVAAKQREYRRSELSGELIVRELEA